jgi:hypothetical protein
MVRPDKSHIAASDMWTMSLKYLIIIVIQDYNGTDNFQSWSL